MGDCFNIAIIWTFFQFKVWTRLANKKKLKPIKLLKIDNSQSKAENEAVATASTQTDCKAAAGRQ